MSKLSRSPSSAVDAIGWRPGKPLFTLADLLQTTLQDEQEEKYKEEMKKMSLQYPSLFGVSRNRNCPSSSFTSLNAASDVNLESSKLKWLNCPSPIDGSEKMGKRKLKNLKKEKTDRTKGPGWFDMPATEMTQERKNDLDALQFRSALDNKRFYKRNNLSVRPKHFQVGRIIEAPADFYHSRVPKRHRKKTIAEEMVAEVSSTVSYL